MWVPNYNETTETSCSVTIKSKVIRALPVLWLDPESLPLAANGRFAATVLGPAVSGFEPLAADADGTGVH